MEFGFDARTDELRRELLAFMDDRIVPSLSVFDAQVAALGDRWAWSTPSITRTR